MALGRVLRRIYEDVGASEVAMSFGEFLSQRLIHGEHASRAQPFTRSSDNEDGWARDHGVRPRIWF